MSCIGAKIGASLSAERVLQVLRSRVVIGLRYKEPPISPQRSRVTRERESLAILALSLPGNPLESLRIRLSHINNIEGNSGPIRGIYLDQVMDLRK